MYKILTNGRANIKTFFDTYEQARSYARSLLRKRFPGWEYRNPPLAMGGYQIKSI